MTSSVRHLTFVSPRYGEEIVGGAEHAVRRLAENCVAHAGIDVSVLTTTAGDERTWSQKYDVGHEVINGVHVQRFLNDSIHRNEFDRWASTLFDKPNDVEGELFDEWLRRQGPYSRDLLDAIEACDSDAIAFHPMLSSPASQGIRRAHVPTILHPALHDEPLSRFPGYRSVFLSADLLAFSMESERNLANDLMGCSHIAQNVIGFGIDEPVVSTSVEQESVLKKYGLASKKYFITVGRVDPGKGSDLLAEFYDQALHACNIDFPLVFVGPVSPSSTLRRSDLKSCITTGEVTEQEKWILISHARALINPSATESFSLVILEAMSVGVPIIVNAACAPTTEHAQASGAGLIFADISEFIAAIDLMSHDDALRDQASENAQIYVSEKYTWKKIIDVYMRVIGHILP